MHRTHLENLNIHRTPPPLLLEKILDPRMKRDLPVCYYFCFVLRPVELIRFLQNLLQLTFLIFTYIYVNATIEDDVSLFDNP